MNNNQEVFDVPTLGYTDWKETTKKVIEFGIKNWNGTKVKKPMVFNFPTYVGTVSQSLTFIAQLNNRFKLGGLWVQAVWNRPDGTVVVRYID
jgi:hypothetical protein